MDAVDVKLLTVFEVAQRLKQSVRQIRQYIKDGLLHVVRLGRAVRVLETDLAEFIAQHRS